MISYFANFVLQYVKVCVGCANFGVVYRVLRIILAPRRQERQVKIRFPLAPFAPLRESLRLILYFAPFAFFAAKFPIRIMSHYVTFVPFVVSCLLRSLW